MTNEAKIQVRAVSVGTKALENTDLALYQANENIYQALHDWNFSSSVSKVQRLDEATNAMIAVVYNSEIISATDHTHFTRKLDWQYKVCGEIIDALRNTLDYNASYIAYLLEQITEEEFQRAAESHAIEFENLSSDELIAKVKLLLTISSSSYTSQDLSSIFRVDESMVDDVLGEMSSMNYTLENVPSNDS